MAIGNGVVIRFTSDTVAAIAGINKVEAALGRQMTAGEKFDAITTRMGIALAAAGAAAGAFAIKLGVDAVQAAAEDEAAMAKLARTMENLGFSARSQEVEQLVGKMQALYGVADTDLRPAFDRLLRSTKDVGEAEKALQIAVDAAAGSGKSLEQVSAAMARGFDGSTTALGKLGIGLSAAVLKSGDMDNITAVMARTFAGQASTAAETYQGRITRLNVAADEAKETIGYALLRAVDNVSKAMGGVGGASGAVQQLGNGFAGLIDTVSAVTKVLNRNADAAENMAQAKPYSEGFWQGLVQLIPVVGTYLSILSRRHEEAAGKAYNQAAAVGALTSRYAALAQAEALANAAKAQNATADRYTALAVQEYGQSVSYTNGNLYEYIESLKKASKEQQAHGGAADTSSKLIEAHTQKMRGEITALNDSVRAFEDAISVRDQYAKSISSSLLGGIDLASVFDPNDITGSLAKFSEQIANVPKFSEAFTKLGMSLGDSEGARLFLEQILTLGTDGGIKFIGGLTTETAANLVTELQKAATSVNGNAFLLANHFEGEGIEAAAQTMEGMTKQIEASEKELIAIGRKIGKPIGATIKAEIAAAVDAAVKAAAAESSRAAAAAAAAVAAAANAASDQATASALSRVVARADARATGTTAVLR